MSLSSVSAAGDVRLLRHPPYLFFFATRVLSRFASQIAAVAVGWQIYDLTGSVDEWTINESGFPFKGALKGGNWGEYRNACRPATLGHDEGFHYYQTGFRCCATPRGEVPRAK